MVIKLRQCMTMSAPRPPTPNSLQETVHLQEVLRKYGNDCRREKNDKYSANKVFSEIGG